MKRLLSAVFAFFLLSGCATGVAQPVKNEKISVVATIFPQYDFTRAIAGDLADITMLLPPASESHSFEPTPQDIIKMRQCGVFIYVGGGSDAWVGGVLESMDTSKIQVITLMDCVEAVVEEAVEGMEEDEDDGEAPAYDEHVWTSPRNAKLIVEKISNALCVADPSNAGAYKANTEAYLAELDGLDAGFRQAAENAARNVIIFGDRFPFRYLADAYGLEYYAAFPGCSTETEASASTLKFLIDKINNENIPVVFHLELSNKKMAEAISESTGARVRLLHACHNISKADFEGGETYLSLMSRNVEELKGALN